MTGCSFTSMRNEEEVWSLPLSDTCGAEQYNAERTKKRRLHLIWRLAFVFVFLLSAGLPQLAHGTKNVLLLFDENDDLPGLATINRNVREVIASELKGDVEFFSESLNLSQFTGADHDNVMLDYFGRKYA